MNDQQLEQLKEVEKTSDPLHVGGLEDLDNLASVAMSADSVRRKYMIAFDATGSMGSYWKKAENALHQAIREIKSRTSTPAAINMVAYKDEEYDSDPLKASNYTDDEDYLKEWVSGIRVDGGGDERESVDLPLKLAIQEHPHMLILLGDACGKTQKPGFAEASRLGQMKCPVYTLYITNSCKPDFEEIAKLSGGRAFSFDYSISEASMKDIILTIISQDKALQISYQPTTIEGKKYLEGMK